MDFLRKLVGRKHEFAVKVKQKLETATCFPGAGSGRTGGELVMRFGFFQFGLGESGFDPGQVDCSGNDGAWHKVGIL